MKISTKGRYALRMMIDLAGHQNSGYISLKDIAQRQNISKKYLEQIIPIFNKSDVLRTNRGSQGGYMLSRTPDKYTVGEILRLTEGSLSAVACLSADAVPCPRARACQTLPLWAEYDKLTHDYFYGKTLKDLVQN